MLEFDDALRRVLAEASELASERVLVSEARGRVLRERVLAASALPEHDLSAMDGYALCAADLAHGGPWSLPVAGESRAGRPAARHEPGSACRIFTGAIMPQGADSVVLQEDVVRDADRIRLTRAPALGEHVRRRGEELSPGQLVLAPGTRLGPGQLGLLAALDRVSCEVSRRPRVAIVCTGDELRAPGSGARPGTIPESNSIVLAALAGGAGAELSLPALVPDDEAVIAEALAAALARHDLVISVGGVSVGDHDRVRPALERAGATLSFWKVRIKPGKPLLLGRAGSAIVLGLPGNPVSAQVTFMLFGLPLLRALQGDARPVSPERQASLAAPLRQRPGRLGFHRGQLDGESVMPQASQGSGSVTSMAWANALIKVPADCAGYERGQRVSVIPFPES